MPLTEEEFKDWTVCWRVNAAFTTEFDIRHASWCAKCAAEIPTGTLQFRSLFVMKGVTAACEHEISGSLCGNCDEDMIFKIVRGEELCFTDGCTEVLQVDESAVKACLSSFHELFQEFSRILPLECIVCSSTFPRRQARTPTATCIHTPNTCKSCMGRMIDVETKSGRWAGIACPTLNCKIKLQFEDIRFFADDEAFDRYESIILSRTLATMPGYMSCKRPGGCPWGQIHPPQDAQPKMRCSKCSFLSCFTCQTPWHEGQTCVQLQFLQTDGESEEYKRKYCKRCPGRGCGAYIKKFKECHEMKCVTQECGVLWCWECKIILNDNTLYSSRHNTQHLATCTAAPVVRARRAANAEHCAVPKPPSYDTKYREGWDRDPGFVGTGNEY